MVRKIERDPLYACEFKGCEREYDTIEQAEKCEAQGLIGPEIEPGLILSGLKSHNGSGLYSVFIGSLQEGHYKQYLIRHLLKPTLFRRGLEGYSFQSPYSSQCPAFHLPNLKKPDKERGSLQLLTEEEFYKVVDMIKRDIKTGRLGYGIEQFTGDFRRTDDYFKPEPTSPM